MAVIFEFEENIETGIFIFYTISFRFSIVNVKCSIDSGNYHIQT